MTPPSTPEEALSFLAALPPSGVRMGLDRIHAALRRLRNPERAYPCLHVAGTNGKGSTCAFAASVLQAQGYRVGLYTSPHLLRMNERIQVNGEPISDALFGQRVLEVLERHPEAAREPFPLVFFELCTLVALWHFAREEVDLVVLETGLGGRLDATTAARAAVSAVTPISYDHMDYLGHTLPAIAQEKAGILKSSVPAVSSRQAPEVLAVLERCASEVGTSLKVEGRDFVLESEAGQGGRTYLYRGLKRSLGGLWLALRGAHQVQNAAVALCALELLADQGLSVSDEAVREGLASAEWPGRLEELPGHPPVLLDGAHNPAGIEALAKALSELYPRRRVHLVFGVLGDKDHRPMIRTLFPRCFSVHLTPVRSARTLLPERYLAEAKALCPVAFGYRGAQEALNGARRLAEADDLVVCTGSLFLLGEIRGIENKADR